MHTPDVAMARHCRFSHKVALTKSTPYVSIRWVTAKTKNKKRGWEENEIWGETLIYFFIGDKYSLPTLHHTSTQCVNNVLSWWRTQVKIKNFLLNTCEHMKKKNRWTQKKLIKHTMVSIKVQGPPLSINIHAPSRWKHAPIVNHSKPIHGRHTLPQRAPLNILLADQLQIELMALHFVHGMEWNAIY